MALSACALLFVGCKKEEAPKEEKKTEQTTEKKEKIETKDNVNPLTGEPMDTEQAKKRPLAIMIGNTKVALPQYGTEAADVIYECPVEGGETRMMALYQDYSNLDRIGSVRSCRLYFPEFANEFNAIYAHYGQAAYAEPFLDSGEVDNLNGLEAVGNKVYYRTSDRKAPHNAFTSTDGINAGIKQMKYGTELEEGYGTPFPFAKDEKAVELTDGQDAAVVVPGYPVCKPWFVYNKESGTYDRFEYGGAHKDAATGNQLSVKNILIQCCVWQYEPDNKYLRINTTSGGEGYYITGGKAIPVTWKKDGNRTHYYTKDGNEITMNQGKTWVCVVQDSNADKIAFYSSEEDYKSAGSKTP
ncbi:MAG: DUF3048 domain-containing protein [Lachnospiraceae bacterium]|nr:DUF3048 domain-containing protein [Lachnospiraceae bacterium]